MYSYPPPLPSQAASPFPDDSCGDKTYLEMPTHARSSKVSLPGLTCKADLKVTGLTGAKNQAAFRSLSLGWIANHHYCFESLGDRYAWYMAIILGAGI